MIAPEQRAAIARLDVYDFEDGRPVSRGSSVLIAPNEVLTALHVVASMHDARPLGAHILVRFRGVGGSIEVRTGTLDRSNIEHDAAVLRLDRPVEGITPLLLAAEGLAADCFGYPQATEDNHPLDGLFLQIQVVAADARWNGRSVVQLSSPQVAAGQGLEVPGLSGSPVLAAGRVVALVRAALLNQHGQAQGSVLYATASEHLRGLVPVVGPVTSPVVQSLEGAAIDRIFDLAIELGLDGKRDVLLVDLPRRYVAILQRLSSTSDQLRMDLHTLNGTPRLVNFTGHPLAAWLKAAAKAVDPRPEAEEFRALAARLGG